MDAKQKFIQEMAAYISEHGTIAMVEKRKGWFEIAPNILVNEEKMQEYVSEAFDLAAKQ